MTATPSTSERSTTRLRGTAWALALAVLLVHVAAPGAGAEPAASPASPQAAMLDAGLGHGCAAAGAAGLRCWGDGASGQLGYAATATIGDD